MDLKKLIERYLQEARMLQVATVNGNQPWCCTVYFASDKDMNLYWISMPDTRHSKEIEGHSKVAGAIPVKFTDLSVVGLSLEGEAVLVKDSKEIEKGIKLYSEKFHRGEEWYNDFMAGKNPHKLYRIKPKLFALFDRENFPENSRQEFKV